MSKYKVGDKVLIKMVIDEIRNNDYAPIWVTLEKDDKSDGMWLKAEQIDKHVSKTYEDGLNDAWELARKSYDFSCNETEKIFGVNGGFYGLIKNYTPQEALAKIEAYEKSQQIEVGDVVHHINSDEDAIVVCKCNDGRYKLMFGDFDISTNKVSEFTKTGRHIDIEHLLEQIRGDD